MAGDRIHALNFALREFLPALKDAAGWASCKVIFQVIAISAEPYWHLRPTPVDQVRWPDLTAAGSRIVGPALTMLATELSGPDMPSYGLPPTVALFLSGDPEDNWLPGLHELNATAWGPHITRLVIAIGKGVSDSTIKRFGGPDATALIAANAASLTEYMRWAPVRPGSPTTSPRIVHDVW